MSANDRSGGAVVPSLDRLLLDAAPDALLLIDQAGVIRHINGAGERLVERSRADLVGQRVKNFIPEADRLLQELLLQESSSAGDQPIAASECYASVRLPDGKNIPIELNFAPVAHGDEMLIGASIRSCRAMPGVENGVNDQPHDDRRLTEAIFDSVPGLLYLYNEDGYLRRWNKKHEEMTGYSAEELSRLKATDWFEGEDLLLMKEAWQQVFEKGYAERELNLIIKGEKKVPYRLTGVRVEIDGKPHLVGIGIDITEQKRALAAISRREAQFRQFLELAPDGIILVRLDGTIAELNQQVEKLFGYKRGELLNQPVEMLLPENLRGPHVAHRREFQRNPQSRSMGAGWELVGRRKDGSELFVEISLSNIDTDDGHLSAAIIRDVTERKRFEQEARQQRGELEHLSRVSMAGELTAALAHELNQPLTAIMNNAQAAHRLIGKGLVDPVELLEIFTDIIADDRRAGEIIRRVRELLKKKQPQFTSVDMNELIHNTCGLVHSDAIMHNVAMRFDLAATVPPVMGDPVQLQQVLLNLIVNAINVMKTEDCSNNFFLLQTRETDGQTVTVSVRDSGPGIPLEKLDVIFASFVTTSAGGLGMGLSLARSIIERHGGRIWAENHPDGGAIFSFTVPVSGE